MAETKIKLPSFLSCNVFKKSSETLALSWPYGTKNSSEISIFEAIVVILSTLLFAQFLYHLPLKKLLIKITVSG